LSILRNELKSLGFSFSKKREFATCDPLYTKWEQEFIIEDVQKWGFLYRELPPVIGVNDGNTVLAK